MTVGQARDAAQQWVMQEGAAIPGFRGAYTAGSTNWLAADVELPAASDLDIMIVLAAPQPAPARRKFRYRDILLEVSYLSENQFQSPDLILSDYHLAPSFQSGRILLDPSGHLASLQTAVRRDYAAPQWVRRRCAHARERVLSCTRSIDAGAPLHDQVISCLFGAGITTHILLAAGLRNPTVRTRYVAVRELLEDCGRLDFHETLLELLGAARMSRERVDRHLTALTGIFDAAPAATAAPFPFASDLSPISRPIAIDGSWELIRRGYHREAMFWIAVTHSRCRQVLPQSFRESYLDLLGDMGLASSAEIRSRCAEIERALPQISQVAEEIASRARQ